MAIVGAEEDYAGIAPLVESQFPDFIREDAPRFVAFLKAYYEFLDRHGEAGYAVRKIRDNQDIDRTMDEFIDHFRREFLPSIPKVALADERMLVKHAKAFYRARGSQESYRFLFRAMFGKEIDFYYPGDDVLRASDGRWVRETVLRVGQPMSTNPTVMEGREVTGLMSGATGRVQGVTKTDISGLEVTELLIEKIVGTFQDGETVRDDGDNTATVVNMVGPLTGVEIPVDGRGAFHQSGDAVRLTSTGEEGFATVSGTTDRSALTFRIVRGGSGYRIADTTASVIGGSGFGARLRVSAISNTVTTSINSDLISSVADVQIGQANFFVYSGANTGTVLGRLTGLVSVSSVSNNVTGVGTRFNTELHVGDLVRLHGLANTVRVHSISSNVGFVTAVRSPTTRAGANAFYRMAGANASSVIGTALSFANTMTGTVSGITLEDPGYGFDHELPGGLPSVLVVDQEISELNLLDGDTYLGRNAVVVANNAPGAITSLSLTDSGSRFNRFEDVVVTNVTRPSSSNTVDSTPNSTGSTVTQSRRKTWDAEASPQISGVTELPGRFIDTRGFVSWNNRLQDNLYYQEFSYAIVVDELVDRYREVVKRALHPAGTRMFGTYRIQPNVNCIPIGVVSEISRQITSVADVDFISITMSIDPVETQVGVEPVISITSLPDTQVYTLTEIYGRSPGDISVLGANSSIAPLANNSISVYANTIIAAFGGSSKFMITINGPSWFANGALMANTGVISVGGPGTKIVIFDNTDTIPPTLNQVNAIVDGSSMRLRRAHPDDMASGYFTYVRSTSNTVPSA